MGRHWALHTNQNRFKMLEKLPNTYLLSRLSIALSVDVNKLIVERHILTCRIS